MINSLGLNGVHITNLGEPVAEEGLVKFGSAFHGELVCKVFEGGVESFVNSVHHKDIVACGKFVPCVVIVTAEGVVVGCLCCEDRLNIGRNDFLCTPFCISIGRNYDVAEQVCLGGSVFKLPFGTADFEIVDQFAFFHRGAKKFSFPVFALAEIHAGAERNVDGGAIGTSVRGKARYNETIVITAGDKTGEGHFVGTGFQNLFAHRQFADLFAFDFVRFA